MFWNGEYLGPVFSLDTETTMIIDPATIPTLIITSVHNGLNSYIVTNYELNRFFECHPKATIVMHNAAFDVAVLKAFGINLDSYIGANRLVDTGILYRLYNIASFGKEPPKWNLQFIAEQLLGIKIDKDAEIRTNFGQFLKDGEVDYSSIPQEFLNYALMDAKITYDISEWLGRAICTETQSHTLLAHQINLLGDLALAQVTRNGICVDQARVSQLRQELEESKIRNETILGSYGYYVGKKGNTKVLDEICKDFELPMTATGKLQKTKTTLEDHIDHPFIKAYLEYKGFNKMQSFLNELDKPKIHPRYLTVKVTSRVSCISPNIQQFPRVGGVRECLIPSPGNIFIDCDYTAIELASLSCVNLKLFGYSKMAELINSGADLHRYLASKIYNIPEEEVTKDQRQFAKVGNFGFGADMGVETFVHHAAKAGYTITMEQAHKVKTEYLRVYPEMVQYFKRARGQDTLITDTGFVRTGCSYTEYLNCAFQTKVAEGAKLALHALIHSGYKVVAFIHDQVLVEHPPEGAAEAMKEIKRLMILGMSHVIKGVEIGVSGEICTTFKK